MKDMIKRMREDKGGFTLAELLIVVAIIMLLVVIAVPAFTGALDNARKASEEGNISNVKSVAAVQYSNEISKGATPKAAASTVSGDYYVDKNKDVVKGTAASADDMIAGPFNVKADVDANGDIQFVVKKQE